MIAAPIPSREAARLAALHRYHILDTSSEPAFDELARLAAYVCRAPIAVISFVDSSRQWFKSRVGLPFAECPRSEAFCAHTILGTDLFIVEEAAADERFADHPWVVESPSICFYAGVPLITPDGHAIGSLAVMDVVPRTLTPEQRACLDTVANQVTGQLGLRNGWEAVWMPPVDSEDHAACDCNLTERVGHQSGHDVHNLLNIMDTIPDFLFTLDCQGSLITWNRRVVEVTGYTREELFGKPALDFVPPEEQERTAAAIRKAFTEGYAELEGVLYTKSGRRIPYHWTGAILKSPQGEVIGITGMGRDVSEQKRVGEKLRHSETRLKEAQRLAQIGDWELDLETNTLLWSDEIFRIFEIDSSTFQASYEGFLNLVHPDDLEMVHRAYSDSVRQRTSYDITHRLLMKDGRIKVVHERCETHYRPDGVPARSVGTVQDITDRKRVEEALEQSEARFRIFLEHAPSPAFLKATDGTYLYVNQQFETALGIPRAEVLGKTDRDLFPFPQAEMFQSHDRQVLEQQQALEFEEITKQTNGLHTSIVVKFPLRDVSGRMVSIGGLATDITERVKTERALRLAQFTIDHAVDAIYWIDPDARIIRVNAAAQAMLGYSEEELYAMTVHDLNPAFQADTWPAFWAETKQSKTLMIETSHRHKHGYLVPVEIQINYLAYEGREYHCAFVRDISGRKEAERALRESEERFRLVAEATNDILWDWDLLTNEHWWSPNAQQKFGYVPDEEPSIAAWMDRLHPDDRGPVLELVDRALASDARTLAAEYRFRLADGSYGHFYDRGQIVRNVLGQAIRMTGAMIDVTQSKRAYAALEDAYQRLQTMSRELHAVESNERRRLSRELHDEVGQLLTGLKFDLQATRQALGDTNAAAIARARERTLRALETTDELFARLRHLVRALRPSVLEELGLKEALEALVSDVQSRSDLVCSVSIDADGLGVLSDTTIETALYRMAQELATNVVRHGQAMTMSIILTKDLRHWILTVQDDGVGFDPQAETIRGLGLRGVRERAEILGGYVNISSIPGAGSTVAVWIPMDGQAQEKA